MKQEINLLKVPFFGAELLLVEHNEQPYVVMKTITESIGLSWQGQHEKLLEHFSKGIKEILIPTNGGVQQMICMNLRKFPAWLYSLQPEEMVAVAWLHDSVEDTEQSIDDLTYYFGKDVAEAVRAITKVDGEHYDKYLARVKNNPIARQVKIADLTHNMDLTRLPVITNKDLVRKEKYIKAKAFLES